MKTRANELDWINQTRHTFGDELDYETNASVFHFSLIWNILESDACARKANRTSIIAAVEQLKSRVIEIDHSHYSEIAEFFRRRYLNSSNSSNLLFDSLFNGSRMTRDDKQSHRDIEEFLKSGSQEPLERIRVLLFIALRVRNNMFHGNKGVCQLHTQTDLFESINRLLIQFVDDHRRFRTN